MNEPPCFLKYCHCLLRKQNSFIRKKEENKEENEAVEFSMRSTFRKWQFVNCKSSLWLFLFYFRKWPIITLFAVCQ